jgi:hypothetical protein
METINILSIPAVITEFDDIIWVGRILSVDDHVYQ